MPDALVERDGHTMVITMNRPKRYNALDRRDARPDVRRDGRGLRRRRHPLDHPHRRRGQLLLGRRPAGHGRRRRGHRQRDRRRRPAWPPTPTSRTRACCATTSRSKPLIAAVEGVAIAGGTELLQGTDIRVAGESARFGVSEARWSLYPMARIGRPAAAPDPLHARGGDPAHREAHHRRGSRRASASSATSCPTVRRSTKAKEIAETDQQQRSARGRGHPAHAARDRRHDRSRKRSRTSSSTARPSSPAEDAKEGPKAFAEKRTPNFQRR